MTKEDYCSFEVSKLLKERGFNAECRAAYTNYGKLFTTQIQQYVTNVLCSKGTLWECTAPTHQMAMKWLREKYNICITIYPDKEKGYEAVLYDIKDGVEIILQSFSIYGSHIFGDFYEQTVEAALRYSLENLI